MTKFLRKLADEKAPVFWCLGMLVFMILGYKTFSTAFLGKTGFSYDATFLRLSLLLIVILIMREIYRGEFCFYFRTKNMLKGFLLGWPLLLVMILNLIGTDFSRPIVLDGFVMTLSEYAIVGLYEEVLIRGFLVGHMMYHWKDDNRKVLKSVLWSSVIFGVLHLGNLFSGQGVATTLLQVSYSTILGIVFAAVFIRTKNLWSVAIIHGLIDFASGIEGIFEMPQATLEVAAGEGSMNLLSLLILLSAMLISLVWGILMLRKKEEIQKLWS